MAQGKREQDSMQRLGELIARLDETQREIQSLTRDQVDAVVLPDGLPFLLSGAQEALRQHEQEQRAHADQRAAILDALPAKVILLDQDGGIIATNARWRLESGSAEAGDNYLDVCDRVQGDDAEYAAAGAVGIREVLAGERAGFSLDYPCPTPENPEGWGRLLAAPLPAAATQAVVMHIDVTAEHLAAEHARREEQYFRQLFESSPMPMWVFDWETLAFLEVNRAAIEHYGYTRDQFLAMTILDIRPVDERERLKKEMSSRREPRQHYAQWKHVRADGSVIDVDIFSDELEFKGRDARLAVIMDVSEQTRHRRIKEAEARVLSAISMREPLETTLHLVVTAIEEIATDTLASVLLLDPEDRRVLHAAASSLPQALVDVLDGSRLGPGVGSCGAAMDRGEPVVVDDIRSDALWCDNAELAELADVLGLRASWSVPVFDSNRHVVGTLALYYREARKPEAWERELVELFVWLVGLAVEQQRQDEALRSSERRLRELFRNAATGIVVVTEQGAFEQANRVFARMIGHAESDVAELNYHQLTHRADREAVREAMRALLSGNSTAETVEQRFGARDGRVIWTRVRLSAQSGREGQPTRIIGVIEDITQRKQAEARLERSRALQRIAGRVGRVGGWSVELDHDRVFWSPEIFDILEWGEGEIPPLSNTLEMYGPGERERVRGALERCAATGQPFDIEAELLTRHGRRLQVRVAGEAETDADGSIVRVIGAFQDITAHKQLEARREELASRLESVLGNMSDAFVLLDRDWIVVYFNRVAERILDPHGNGLLGRNHWALFPEARATEVWNQYRHAMESGESVHFELYYDPLGEWFQINAYPSAEGLALYFTITTERRQLREQLQQAQRLESVGQLTGGIAHDFNNLLTVILGNAELLVESLADSEELEPIARTIGDAAMRGAELTRRLLAFARRQPLEPAAVDVNRLIHDMENLLRQALGEQCEMKVSRADGLWSAMIDASQFESALMNLTINARDAMPKGGRLTIETANVRVDEESMRMHPGVDAGEYVTVAVSDTGTGISADSLDKVFEPFFTTKEKGRGTGLGLSMLYGFIKQSSGHVRIRSEIGEGTTLRLYLPRAGLDALPPPAPVDHSATVHSANILVVEDEPSVRQFAGNTLAQLGYGVRIAGSGREALELLEQGIDCDLLFTDVVMPGGMGGRELVEAARRLRPELKVLYTSGYTENAIVHRGRLDPGVHLLSKPYRRDELARRVRRALDEEPVGRGRDDER